MTRIYDRRLWKRQRLAQLEKEPLCRYCTKMGVITAATVVDHIKPHRGDERLAHDPNNLQSLCKPCHDVHADAKDKGKTMAGSDVDGFPLDPLHPWFS